MKMKNLLIVLGIFLMVLCNSIVYGALNTDMFIDGDAYVRIDRNIRVTGIKVLEQNNGAYETYNCDYSKDTTSIQVTLPSSDSFIVYEITITNKGDIDYELSNIVEESYSNSNIKYEIIDLEKGTVIDRETTYTFKIKLTTTENNSENKGTLVLKYDFQEWVPSLYNMVVHNSRSLDTNLDFNVVPTKETSGVYEMDSTKDDEYPVYYYRGIVENNNVSFAGFCWKVVRTTSTGGVKLIYNGVVSDDGSCDNTGDASRIGTSAFNTNYTSQDDVSYMYDNGTDSTIKKVIDKWYSNNMVEYTDMLEDTVWCNDRSIVETSSCNPSGCVRHFFGPSKRNVNASNPSINCSDEGDRFTVSSINGNGKLIYPVALLTADEVTLAGTGYSGYSDYSYLANGNTWRTISPYSFYSTEFYASVFSVSSPSLKIVRADNENDVRPSVSLVSGTMIKSGNGSVSNPYKLVEEKIQTEWVFDYTGREQEFKIPYDGVYKLETWGAQGGNSIKSENYRGGYGAYSTGMISLSHNQQLYINVGGQGSYGVGKGITVVGGYNGGGNSNTSNLYQVASDSSVGGGGGATHISEKSGLLSTLSDSLISVLIVAGGGGGGSWHNSDNSGSGGNAGGIVGSNSGNPGPHTQKYNRYGVGGNQNSGGCSSSDVKLCGSFGKGADATLADSIISNAEGSGGGSGYYGGTFGYATGGGGGSSYIGNPLLSNKAMYCYECEESSEESTKTVSTTNVSEEPISLYAKKGNGYVKITLIEKK